VVKSFFTLEYNKDITHTDYLLPDGLPSLFYLQANKPVTAQFGKRVTQLRPGFHAAYSDTLVKFRHGRFKIAGASIFPVYFHLLSGKSLLDIVNRFVPLDASTFTGGTSLPASAASARVLALLEKHMTMQLARTHHDETFSQIYRSLARPGGYSQRIDVLAEKLGYSTRSLHTYFRRHFGMPPKRFIKLLRFNYALKYVYDHHDQLNLSAIAHEAGYHDQSHLIREFKSICGKTPGEIAGSAAALATRFRLF
jgi:AraC-like DNA-binding protein